MNEQDSEKSNNNSVIRYLKEECPVMKQLLDKIAVSVGVVGAD